MPEPINYSKDDYTDIIECLSNWSKGGYIRITPKLIEAQYEQRNIGHYQAVKIADIVNKNLQSKLAQQPPIIRCEA